MARVKPLSDNKIKTSKPKEKEYKLADGDGLYVHIMPNGSKLWRLRYTLNGKSTTMSLGKYPEVSLSDARELRAKHRESVAKGKKPGKESRISDSMNFRDLSEKYFAHKVELSADTVKAQKAILERDVHPGIGDMIANDVSIDDVIDLLEKVEERQPMRAAKKGAKLKETPRKVSGLLNRIFKYGCTKRWLEINPMGSIDLSVLLKARAPVNRAHTTDIETLKVIVKSLESYVGDYATKTAIELMPYVFVRPANLAAMEWGELDLDKKLWTIPDEKMKMGRDHVVPLTDTMIELIKRMEGNNSKFVFRAPRTASRSISRDTLNAGLQRLGFKGVQSAHGFRHTASTIMHENIHVHGVHTDAIEMQLAHVEKNAVKGTYNKALYIEERSKLMHWWSDFVDDLKRSKG